MDKVFIAIPVARHEVEYDFMCCLMNLQAQAPCPIQIVFQPGNFSVAEARNNLAAQFLKTDCTHLLFVDADMTFAPQQIIQLLQRKLAVVGGMYAIKSQEKFEICASGPIFNFEVESDGLREFERIGTGFLMIAREVFETLIAKFGEQLWYTSKHTQEKIYDLFPTGPFTWEDGTREYLTEDWGFCRLWRATGGKVFGDAQVTPGHIGKANFPIKQLIPQS